MKKRITALGVPVVAVAAVALGGAGTAPAASVCAYNNQYHVTKRHQVSCKDAKKVLKDYLNNGCPSNTKASATRCTVQHHRKWKCPNPFNDQSGKCVKDSNTSFKYKSNY